MILYKHEQDTPKYPTGEIVAKAAHISKPRTAVSFAPFFAPKRPARFHLEDIGGVLWCHANEIDNHAKL
mgnify:CR=1 FL=1